tara:strand:- start:130 stop:1023 length:894 start_codon:yes stop_codon:yes gene_type:complete
MNRALKITALLLMATTLSGCYGKKVTVPPAFEGKVLGKNGYLPDTYPPSSFRLASCWALGSICEQLILIDKSDKGMVEKFTLFMPKSDLTMSFDIRLTASIKDGKTDAILNRVQPVMTPTGKQVIQFDNVYDTYAKPIIRDAVRSVLAEYTIDQVASSRDAVNAELVVRVGEALKNTPVGLKQFALASVEYPEIITKRKEQAEERRIEIDQEEARKQVELIKIQTSLEKAKANRAIRRENAEAAAEENEIAAKSITPQYLEYKKLEVLMELAQSGAAVFVPFDALGTVGLQQKVFGK